MDVAIRTESGTMEAEEETDLHTANLVGSLDIRCCQRQARTCLIRMGNILAFLECPGTGPSCMPSNLFHSIEQSLRGNSHIEAAPPHFRDTCQLQPFLLAANPSLRVDEQTGMLRPPVCLSSRIVSTMNYAQLSNHQQVTLTGGEIRYECVWYVEKLSDRSYHFVSCKQRGENGEGVFVAEPRLGVRRGRNAQRVVLDEVVHGDAKRLHFVLQGTALLPSPTPRGHLGTLRLVPVASVQGHMESQYYPYSCDAEWQNNIENRDIFSMSIADSS